MLKSVPRTSDLKEFRERYFSRQFPAVVTGTLASMPASKWTMGYLTEVLGHHRPVVKMESGDLAYIEMRNFLRYLDAPASMHSSRGSAHLKDFYLTPTFGDAARARAGADIRCPLVDDEEWPEWRRAYPGFNTLYAGPTGSRSPLHVDPYDLETWLAEIIGVKAVRLTEPHALTAEQAKGLEAFADGPMPCEFYECLLEPGETLYIPPNWWHAVENKTSTVAVSGNFCTLDHARACAAEVAALPEGDEREIWLRTWTGVIEAAAAG